VRIPVLGVGFDNLTMDEAVSAALAYMERRGAGGAPYVVTPNPEIVWLCRSDKRLQAAADGAALVLPDGVGIIRGAKILGTPLRARVPGIDFASALFEKMAPAGRSVYLLGAKPGVAETASARLAAQYPGLQIMGCADGYFTDDAPVVAGINAKAPDLLLVCLGAPKQEIWMAENAGRINARLGACLGGAFDVFAGVVPRAPERWRRLGLEWLYRLLREPRRVGRMMKLPLFLLAAIGKRITGKNER
jgi:N-acetylglucosaminyldiphosphoundecaprenol N-acetyl-beta-D-mannosaminyltransferase